MRNLYKDSWSHSLSMPINYKENKWLEIYRDIGAVETVSLGNNSKPEFAVALQKA